MKSNDLLFEIYCSPARDEIYTDSTIDLSTSIATNCYLTDAWQDIGKSHVLEAVQEAVGNDNKGLFKVIGAIKFVAVEYNTQDGVEYDTDIELTLITTSRLETWADVRGWWQYFYKLAPTETMYQLS